VTSGPITLCLRFAGLLAAMSSGSPAHGADAAHPTVVELFQSQGCSSCPPANANVMALADRPDLLTLSWQVTYWDSLGWKDTFDDPAFTRRQYEYAAALGHDGVFTPDVVVNGRSDVVGSNRDELAALVRLGDRGDGGPSITVSAGQLDVTGATPSAPARVLLVRYDPSILQVPIRRGENGGRTLPHRNVVRQVIDLGFWTGGAAHYVLPIATDPHLRSAVLVQTNVAGPILAAARL
jgi:hypothetical protein